MFSNNEALWGDVITGMLHLACFFTIVLKKTNVLALIECTNWHNPSQSKPENKLNVNGFLHVLIEQII